MSDKMTIENLNDKCRSLTAVAESNEETAATQAAKTEEMIDKRVKKIIEQERDLMKEQKRVILSKQKLQD